MRQADNLLEWLFENVHMTETVNGNHGAIVQLLPKMIQWMRKLNTDGLELFCYGFSKMSHFLQRILMEHIDMKTSLGLKLEAQSI